MIYACSPIDMSASSFLIDSVLPLRRLPGLPGGNLLFFASPKKSKQKKGDPQSGSLRFASGTLRCSGSAEFLETSRLRRRRTSKNLFPLLPALLSPARTGGGGKSETGTRSGSGSGSGSQSPYPSPLPSREMTRYVARSQISFFSPVFLPPQLGEGRGEGSPIPRPTPLPKPVLAGLEKDGGDGLKNLDVRRLRSRQVSRFSGTFNFFKEPRSGPDCGSPFFWLLFFGR